MRRIAAALSCLIAGGPAPGQDDPPPLVPPAETAAPTAPARDDATLRPVPPRRPAPARRAPGPDLPPLVGPGEMGRPEALPLPRPEGEPGRPASPPPLTLEPAPGDLEPLPGPRAPSRAERREPLEEPAPREPSPRRRGLFGLRPGPRSPAASRPRAGRDDEPAVRVEPKGDPASDAALKRRVEAAIREAAGSRLRSLEVRVTDRSVVVRARPDRFWHRRALRRTIEGLPELAGHRAKVDVGD